MPKSLKNMIIWVIQ